MSQELLREVCRNSHLRWVGFICLCVASFLKMCLGFDLGVISTQVIIKIMDVDEIVKEEHTLQN